MLARVGGEVEVELRDRGLHDTPHRLAKVGHEAHQLQSSHVFASDGSEVRLEQVVACVLVELVVDREVREIEERVAHSCVLPVDDAQARRRRQRKFAFSRSLWQGFADARPRDFLDPRRDLVHSLVGARDRPAARACGIPVALDDAKGVEAARNRRALVDRSQRSGHAGEHRRFAHLVDGRRRSLDEARDEPSLRLDERDHLRPDAERGCGPRRLQLDGSIDAELIRVLARDPQDEDLAVDLDLEVVVRDPASQGLDVRLSPRPHPLDGGSELAHARIRAPCGSKRGSAAISPATQSPKISTSTCVPTACSAGTYA